MLTDPDRHAAAAFWTTMNDYSGNGGNLPAATRRRERTRARRITIAHRRRGIALRFGRFRAAGKGAILAFLAVLGPGLLAGFSDDDPAGITTYSMLGADHGYRLLWIIPLSTVLLVYFHLVAVHIGAASGKGFVAVIRERWGHRIGYAAVAGLLFANFGTICAEYAGISAAASLVGSPSWISTPVAAVLISLVVVLGSFHRVEGVLLVISSTLALYIIDGILAQPDWSLVVRNSLIPQLPLNQAGWLAGHRRNLRNDARAVGSGFHSVLCCGQENQSG